MFFNYFSLELPGFFFHFFFQFFLKKKTFFVLIFVFFGELGFFFWQRKKKIQQNVVPQICKKKLSLIFDVEFSIGNDFAHESIFGLTGVHFWSFVELTHRGGIRSISPHWSNPKKITLLNSKNLQTKQAKCPKRLRWS